MDKLYSALIQAECPCGDIVFDLSEPSAGLTSYVPAKAIRMLDMPLYQVIDAAKREDEEMKEVNAALEAEATLSKVRQATAPKKRGRPRK
ncbi:hypothetical protein D9M68_977770 [compost metagenome]